jgi:hypothetical protein
VTSTTLDIKVSARTRRDGVERSGIRPSGTIAVGLLGLYVESRLLHSAVAGRKPFLDATRESGGSETIVEDDENVHVPLCVPAAVGVSRQRYRDTGFTHKARSVDMHKWTSALHSYALCSSRGKEHIQGTAGNSAQPTRLQIQRARLVNAATKNSLFCKIKAIKKLNKCPVRDLHPNLPAIVSGALIFERKMSDVWPFLWKGCLDCVQHQWVLFELAERNTLSSSRSTCHTTGTISFHYGIWTIKRKQ